MSEISKMTTDTAEADLSPENTFAADMAMLLEKLCNAYSYRNVKSFIEGVDVFRNTGSYLKFCSSLIREKRCKTTRIDEVTGILVEEVQSRLQSQGDLEVQANYFEIEEQLKIKFGEDLSSFYMSVKMPSDFLSGVRQQGHHGDINKLSNDLVNEYKREMIRVEKGRRLVIESIRPFSHLPPKHVHELNDILQQLYLKLKTNYKYLVVKPYLQGVYRADSVSFPKGEVDPDLETARVFNHYLESGEEPPVADQITFHIAIHKLFKLLEKKELIPGADREAFFSGIADILSYQGSTDLAPKGRRILEELLVQVNRDKAAIRSQLAKTFVEEYHCAEAQMLLRRNMIENELASTREYLSRIAHDVSRLKGADEERARFALEKLVCLKDVFAVSDVQQQVAAAKPFDRVERSALEISTLISPEQLTRWIRIYSIIFSNSEFLTYDDRKIDFSVMQGLISDLTTFHLVQNIAQLKIVVDRSISASEEKKTVRFRQFNEALKLKLQGMMVPGKQQGKSLRMMIEELGFLQHESAQFVIAETFKGFQIIVDAFNAIADDYFVQDKEALLNESRGLYDQICTKCLKGLVSKTPELNLGKPPGGAKPEKSWLSRLFFS